MKDIWLDPRIEPGTATKTFDYNQLWRVQFEVILKVFLAVRWSFSLNPEFRENCWCYTSSFWIPKQTSSIKFYHQIFMKSEVRYFRILDVDLCIKRWCSLKILIIYCICYFKCYTDTKAYKLGKYGCPTTFTSSILYIYTVDVSISFKMDYFAVVVQVFSWMLIFFSFYNPVPPPH